MGIKNRFELGEIDPWNWGQYDGDEYQLAVAWLENFQVLPQGGLNRRRGYERVATLPAVSAMRLVHIVADDQDYVLALRTGGYGIFDCEARSYSGRNYSTTHPTTDASLNTMRYCTRKNVAAFVARDCPPFYIKVEGGATTHGLIEVTYDVKVVETKPEGFTAENRIIILDNEITSLAEQTIGHEAATPNHATDPAAEKDVFQSTRVKNHPQVIAYIANRIWFANTEGEPNKIWVSRRTEDITHVNMSTYDIYSTVYEEFLAFSGRNNLGESVIDKLNGDGHMMRLYSQKVIKDEAPSDKYGADASRVDYGVDPTMLNRTSYFREGGALKDINPDLNVSTKSEGNADLVSEPVEEEYTEEAIAQTEAEYTRKMNMFAARKVFYAVPGGFISANCYGCEAFIASVNITQGFVKDENGDVSQKELETQNPFQNPAGVGKYEGKIEGKNFFGGDTSKIDTGTYGNNNAMAVLINTTYTQATKGTIKDESEGNWRFNWGGYNITIQQLFPFTEWGEDWSIASVESASAIGVSAKINDPLFTLTTIAIMARIPFIRTEMKDRCKNNLKLTIEQCLEGAQTYDVTAIGLNVDSNIHPDYLTNILQYIKTKLTLYSKIQPFVGIYHKVKVEEYSSADCGFTFSIAGGTGEAITDIQENQDIMILTAKSERMADYTINGETQLVRKIGGEGSEFVKSTLTGAALYMMRTGFRSMQKLQWQPGMNAPGMIQTNQRNSNIMNNFITRFIYASETFPKKIRLISEEGGVIGVQLLLGTEAFYRETTHGQILDMQSFKVKQDENIYVARKDDNDKVWLDVLIDSIGRGVMEENTGRNRLSDHIFLDSWTYNGEKSDYDDTAVLYDKDHDRVYLYDAEIPAGTQYYIGYPYMSKVRTLPTVGFGDMRAVRIPRVKIRLLDSCMPFINGYPEGDELNPNIITDQQNRRSGIFNVPVPGTNHCDAAYEMYTNYPDSLSVLAICEEGV
jgi:hypothetical protein